MNLNEKCCRVEVNLSLIEQAKVTLAEKTTLIEHKEKIFSLLGNGVRLKILLLFLEYEKLCVCDLADVLEMKQSPISQHLRKLKDGGLLINRKEGMTVFYFIPSKIKSELEQLIKG